MFVVWPFLLSFVMICCMWRSPPTWPATGASPACTPSPIFGSSCAGATNGNRIRCRYVAPMWSVRPLAAGIRRFKPSTVSRRLSMVTGFYRICVIDAVPDDSPADYVRRPPVPAESPTLGL